MITNFDHDKIVESCGDFFRRNHVEVMEGFGRIEHTSKVDQNDIVTEKDRWLEEEIRSLLGKITPGVDIVGEEFGGEPDRTFWTVDPIDDTQAYTRGMPNCSSMLSLVVDDIPEMAIVYNFQLEQLYSAVKGQGAYRDGAKIHVSDRPIDRSYIRTHVDHELHKALYDAGAYRVTISNFVLDVAFGGMDAFVVRDTGWGIWDYIPRAIIMSEAGAKVTNFDNDQFDWRSETLLAANPYLHSQIREATRHLLQRTSYETE